MLCCSARMFEATGILYATCVLLAVTGCLLLWNLLQVGRRPKDFPPGPPTLPIIGNLHQMPKENLHIQYRKWAREYGPIYSLKLGSATMIVLADGQVIRDLVDLKGVNFADRPHTWVTELWENSRTILRGYDDLLKLERKQYHALLNVTAAQKYIPYQDFETLKLVSDLVQTPNDWVQHFGRMTGSIMTSIIYGFRLPDKDNADARELLENSHGFFQCVVKSQLLDCYPLLRAVLRWIPHSLNPLASSIVKAYAAERAVFQKYYARALRSTSPCFAHDIEGTRKRLEEKSSGQPLLTHHAATYLVGVTFEGGAETTRFTLQGFVKAMAMYPEVQKKAQAEVDRVVGSDEVPSTKHILQLPYVNQVLKETVRWMPTGVNGAVPHATTKEEIYRGFRIPARASIVLSVWSANHQEQDFDDPREFLPERQVAETSLAEAATAATAKERGQYSFGAGRRICPGMHLARNVMFLTISRILWAFDIRPKLDAAGNPVPIDRDAMTQGLAVAPAPFDCVITPRSAQRVQVLQKEWKTRSEQLLASDGNYKTNILEL